MTALIDAYVAAALWTMLERLMTMDAYDRFDARAYRRKPVKHGMTARDRQARQRIVL